MNARVTPPLTRVKACVDSLRALGVDGPFAGTTLVGTAMFGLRTRGESIVLTDLWVSPSRRSSGLGRQLLEQLLAYADFHQVPVRLRPCAFDRRHGTGPDTPRLRRWYLRYGFAPRGQQWMVRAPRPFRSTTTTSRSAA